MILLGMILYLDAVLSLVLVPIFVWVVEKRFIEAEEMRLQRKVCCALRQVLATNATVALNSWLNVINQRDDIVSRGSAG